MDLMALHVILSQYLSWLHRRHDPCLFDARINHRLFDLRETEGFARRRLNRCILDLIDLSTSPATDQRDKD